MSLALRLVLIIMVPLVLASSCTLKKDSAPETATEGSLPEGEPVINFSSASMRIKDQTISVELAQSPNQRSRGLMYRKSLPRGQGMLFLFESPQYLSFYMKNTFVPLSIAYLDANKVIIDIQDMTPAQPGQESFPIYISKGEAQFALEVPQGWFTEKDIKVGDRAEWNF